MVGNTSDDRGRPAGNDTLYDRQIQTLYDALDADRIAEARRVLGYIGDGKNQRAVDPLIILLEYPDETIQGDSALALGRIGDTRAVDPLVGALKKSSDKVKISIVNALGMLGDPGAIGAIEAIPLTPDEPKLINAVRSTVFKLKHLDETHQEYFPPDGIEEEPQDAYEAPMPDMKSAEDITVQPPADKNPLLSAILSFLVPGFGQVYNGEGYAKGILYLIGFYCGLLLFVFPGMLVWLYGTYSAYKTAKNINNGIAGSTPTTLLGIAAFLLLALFIVPVIFGFLVSAIFTFFILGSGMPPA